VTVLVDSDVLIDCLRATPEALVWLRASRADGLLVPGIVALEVLAGCRNRREQGQVRKFLARFPVVWPEAREGAAAMAIYLEHGLAHGTGILDSMVAAMAIGRGLRLLTFNLRHYRAVEGLDAAEPYPRPPAV
jgi:predicted nucleic acid-binding protein